MKSAGEANGQNAIQLRQRAASTGNWRIKRDLDGMRRYMASSYLETVHLNRVMISPLYPLRVPYATTQGGDRFMKRISDRRR